MTTLSRQFRVMVADVAKTHKENTLEVENYVYGQLVSKSPVDSGAYRANHNRSVGQVDNSFSSSITSRRLPQPVSGLFEDYYLSNAAPYAEAIENGHSNQAPAGVYKVAANSAKAKYGV